MTPNLRRSVPYISSQEHTTVNNADIHKIQARINEAFRFLDKRRQDDATAIFDELRDIIPDDKETQTQFGFLCTRLGEHSQAINYHSKAVLAAPENAVYLGHLGGAYLQAQRNEEAYAVLAKSLELDPENPDNLLNFSIVNLSLDRHAKAVEMLEKVIEKRPNDPSAIANLALANKLLDKYEEASHYAKKAVKIDPKNPYILHLMGRILTELGKSEEAIDYFQQAISIDKTCGQAYADISGARKFTKDDTAIIRKFENALQLSMPSYQRAFIHYGLGKIYDDCKDWEQAFKHFQQGSLLTKAAYDITPPRKRFNQVKKVFDRKLLSNSELIGSHSEVPVFVVGMPRSGTTLIEQIIASHPRAAGAGELREIPRIFQSLCMTEGEPRVKDACNKNLTKENLSLYAQSYLDLLQNGRDDAERIVDKLPDNFLHVGLINRLFPDATIIHAVRHPLDTCLSCYFQKFTMLDWSFDLKWIAERYRFYREMMSFWEKVLPENKILTVQYESLIEAPEREIRRILDKCGLPWDSACLEFNKTSRSVQTASLWQVRQPIYRSSRGRWTNYARHLQPLAKRLSQYLTDDDLAVFSENGIKTGSRWGLDALFSH